MRVLLRKILIWGALGLILFVSIKMCALIYLSSQVGRITGTPGSTPEGISREELDDAEIVCSGHFQWDWNPFSWPAKVELTFHQGHTWGAERTIRSFKVDHYWKGSGPDVLDVALFHTSTNHEYFVVPTSERLLLALKKDTTGSDAYQFVEQMDTWLVIKNHADDQWAGLAPEEVVENLTRDDLDNYAAQPLSASNLRLCAGITHALLNVSSLGMKDDKTIALLEKIVTEPGSNAYVCGPALYALNKIDPEQEWKLGFQVYESGAFLAYDRKAFVGYVTDAIRPETLSKIDPVEIQKMIDSSPEAENYVSIAFMDMKDQRAIPWLGRLLSSRNRLVQYHAMTGLEQNFNVEHTADFTGGFTNDDPPYPEEVVAPYKAWVQTWTEQHPEYALPSSPVSK